MVNIIETGMATFESIYKNKMNRNQMEGDINDINQTVKF